MGASENKSFLAQLEKKKLRAPQLISIAQQEIDNICSKSTLR